MKYIELTVKTHSIVHGFDNENKEIIEKPEGEEFMTKLVAIDRIQSVSESFLLVSGSHGRVMYWEYEGDLALMKKKLKSAGLFLG